tara:strand:+ start:963 stop:1340 length:378 start_codon:yes stop_codon:yes gene_type:complete
MSDKNSKEKARVYSRVFIDFYDSSYILNLLKTRNFMNMIPNQVDIYMEAYQQHVNIDKGETIYEGQTIEDKLKKMENDYVINALHEMFNDTRNVNTQKILPSLDQVLVSALNEIERRVKEYESSP